MASTALLPSCAPTILPVSPVLLPMGEPRLTMMIWWFCMYGDVNAMFCLRFSVIVRPFQSASTRLPISSASLAFQSIGLNSTCTPMRFAASRAMSISKPTSSFFSLRKPIGGKLSSRPMTTLGDAPLSAADWSADFVQADRATAADNASRRRRRDVVFMMEACACWKTVARRAPCMGRMDRTLRVCDTVMLNDAVAYQRLRIMVIMSNYGFHQDFMGMITGLLPVSSGEAIGVFPGV